MKFGCHVSIGGGVFNAPGNAAALGCEVFQMFTRSPQGGVPPVIDDAVSEKFKASMKEYGFSECVVHTPYFINFGSSVPRIFYGSVSVVRQELERASLLGASYVVTHLGSFKDLGQEKGLKQVVSGLEKILKDYGGSARLLIENSAGAGDVIGDTFEEISDIIHHKSMKKYKLGVCFDTAHAFASGYDLRTSENVAGVFGDFDKIVGLNYLCAIHANDSKIDLGGKRDRHDHIGAGKIGAPGFRAIISHPKLKNTNMYLETEHDKVKQDLKTLKALRAN